MRYIAAFATLVAGAAFVSAAPTCASRQYLDAATGLCKQCPTSTMTCSSATVAITCARGRYLTSTKQCVTGNACPSGTFADSATTTCKKCYGANVDKCKDATPTGATACVSGSCLSSGKCLYIARMLPTTFCSNGIVTACPNGASRCDSTGAVMSCKTGFNLAASGECVQCTGGATWNSATKTCDLACRTTATTHYEPDREESVIDSTAQYLDSATQTCKDCLDPFAKSCGNDGRATACLTEFYRGLTDEGTCIRCNTKPGYYLDDDSGKCELYCPSAQWNWQSTMQTGVAQYAVNGVCVDCADPLAYTCKNGVTGSCVPWAHLENGVCISCPEPDQQWDAAAQACVPLCNLVGRSAVTQYGGIQIYAIAKYFDPPTRSCKGCSDSATACDPATGKALGCMPPTGMWANGLCGF